MGVAVRNLHAQDLVPEFEHGGGWDVVWQDALLGGLQGMEIIMCQPGQA